MISKAQIKYIQSLRHKKYRRLHAAFVAEGDKLVMELLQSGGMQPLAIFALDTWFLNHANLLHNHPALETLAVGEQDLERASALSSPNQVIGIFRMPEPVPSSLGTTGIQLVLDDVQDPGNLGTIIRIADWFGLKDIWCSMQTADCFNSKALQSTMGSIARVQVHYADLEQLLGTHDGIPVYAATLDGISLWELPRVSSCALVIGNESRGVSEEILSLADQRISIPRIGSAESLNAAVATGILCSGLVFG